MGKNEFLTPKAIANRIKANGHHIHMNSTQWATLTEFVKYLGRTGKCKVDETPKGWFITYIDRDSETLFKEKMKNKRAKADIVDEEKQEREIRRQIERAEQLISGANGVDKISENEDAKLLSRSDDGGEKKIKLSIGSSTKNMGKEKGEGSSRFVFDEVDDGKKFE
ncbi:hypothetical protein E3N88_14994 [Mikania micrantha]|uniref:DNA/RNA-binding protein Kin17 WH-like domain-containing protein n=1 Tax=Mikania micrantha TaxID=192012 RepID=A0A5N6P305_9ASTR|nr:hypothetical protein E3N88_14994 [Mikania micrantha]